MQSAPICGILATFLSSQPGTYMSALLGTYPRLSEDMFLLIAAEIKGDTTPVNRTLIEPVILLGGISEKPLAFIGQKHFHITIDQALTFLLFMQSCYLALAAYLI